MTNSVFLNGKSNTAKAKPAMELTKTPSVTVAKQTNSELNRFDDRHQNVVIANYYRQDFVWPGYTAQLSFHYNLDQAGSGDPGGQHYDTNGFLDRPALIGNVTPHDLHAYYLGWTGDGHIGRLNLTHAFYQVFGTDDNNHIRQAGDVIITVAVPVREDPRRNDLVHGAEETVRRNRH